MASPKVTASLQDDRGTWTVRGRVFDPVTGKMKQRTKSTGLRVKDKTKRKAEAVMREIVAEWEQQSSAIKIAYNPLFEDCVNQWMERKKNTLRANTVEGYKVAANAHIIPELGQIRIADLTRKDVQHYFDKLQRDGISTSTLKKHRVIIQGVLQSAVLEDLLTVNVAENISLPKGKKFEGKALSEACSVRSTLYIDDSDHFPSPYITKLREVQHIRPQLHTAI